jgi:hypothetical protein
MPGLTNELYQRCRGIFLKCSEFNSDAALRAIFVTDDLYPFRDGLPQVSSTKERVDACLDYLLPKHLSDGRAVLPLFIAALRDRYQEGNALRDELEALRLELEQQLDTQASLGETRGDDTASTRSTNYSPAQLRDLANVLARSYGPIELADLARSLGMRAPLSPRDRRGACREIVLSAHQLGRLDELILRLQMDGKL